MKNIPCDYSDVRLPKEVQKRRMQRVIATELTALQRAVWRRSTFAADRRRILPPSAAYAARPSVARSTAPRRVCDGFCAIKRRAKAHKKSPLCQTTQGGDSLWSIRRNRRFATVSCTIRSCPPSTGSRAETVLSSASVPRRSRRTIRRCSKNEAGCRLLRFFIITYRRVPC